MLVSLYFHWKVFLTQVVIALLIITRIKNKPIQYISINGTFLSKCYVTKLGH